MSNRKEIETKFEINDKLFFTELFHWMEKNGKLVEKKNQHDVYYSPNDENYMEETYPYKWLRLRHFEDGTAEICFKHFYPEGAEQHLYCDEHQSLLNDSEAITEIFTELGFRIIANVDKKRVTYLYDRYLVSFDVVKDLGEYIEVEVAQPLYSEEKERALLCPIIEMMGLTRFPIDLRGYPYLVYKKARNKVDDNIDQ